MTIENPPRDHSEEETPREEFDFENGWKDIIKERIQRINDTKAKLEELKKQAEVWRDFSPHSQDNTDIDKLVKIIEEEKESALDEIKLRFNLLKEEVMQETEIKSISGEIYKPEAVAEFIENIKNEILAGGKPDLRVVTRTLNLRSKVSELADLVSQII